MPYLLQAYFNATSQIDLFNATHDVKRALRESQATHALLTVFVPGPTAGVVLVENDQAIKESLKDMIASFVTDPEGPRPQRKSGTGHLEAHLRASFLSSSIVIPIYEGKLLLGPWQEILVIDFDNKAGRREVLIHVLTETPPKK